jgi:hypothetical protein
MQPSSAGGFDCRGCANAFRRNQSDSRVDPPARHCLCPRHTDKAGKIPRDKPALSLAGYTSRHVRIARTVAGTLRLTAEP